MTTIVAQPFNVIKWQLKFNPVAQGLSLNLSPGFSKNSQTLYFFKIRPMGTEMFRGDGKT
jgi:hypothetical protein